MNNVRIAKQWVFFFLFLCSIKATPGIAATFVRSSKVDDSASCISEISTPCRTDPSDENMKITGLAKENGYIYMHLGGRLGNQMFQIAAALSLAEDVGAKAIFPDLVRNVENLSLNYQHFFSSLDISRPLVNPSFSFSEHPHFEFQPILFQPNMEVFGYFQSEKYFKHNKEKVCSFFEPSEDIRNYLSEKYKPLLDHPNTVAMHLRAYKLESVDIEKCFPFLKGEFYIKATEIFPDDALFVIFSDRIEWAKEELKNLNRPHIFIESETHYHDFYLMSFCKHQILSTSSFGWWAAYLNKNPDKKVVAPDPWFSPISMHDSTNVIPEDWLPLSWQP